MSEGCASAGRAKGQQRKSAGVTPLRVTILAIIALATCASGALAQSMSDRLSADRTGDIQEGNYAAGDSVKFTLDPYGEKYLLRIADDREVYVLSSDRASLGGHVLKYDSGTTALLISGWGGMTLYTDAQPDGLPAVRDDLPPTPPTLAQVSLSDVQRAAQDEAQHLAYVHQLNLNFSADWAALGTDTPKRALAFDVLQNAARGLERFAASPTARAALAHKIDSVKIEAAPHSATSLSGRTLIVSFNSEGGFAGRESSRAIARDLSKLLGVPRAQN
jgi:hypothetical protein